MGRSLLYTQRHTWILMLVVLLLSFLSVLVLHARIGDQIFWRPLPAIFGALGGGVSSYRPLIVIPLTLAAGVLGHFLGILVVLW